MQTRGAVLAIGAIVLGTAVVAGFGAAGKSPTNDEPYHLASAVAIARLADHRADPEDPPLVKRVVGVGIAGVAAPIDTASPAWANLTHDVLAGRPWATHLLYHQGGVDTDALWRRTRLAMLILGSLVGLLTATLAWRWIGPGAGVAAAAFLLVNPIVLAHWPLMKTDWPLALMLLALTGAIKLVLDRATPGRIALLGVVCGLALLTKLSAVVCPAMILLALLLRAFTGRPWPSAFGPIVRRRSRALLGLGILLIVGIISYAVLWSGYGFRFSAAADGSPMSRQRILATIAAAEHRPPADPPSPGVRAMLWTLDRHLLPEAYGVGLLYMRGMAAQWPHFFHGQVINDARPSYYPLALAVKSPLAWLILLLAAIVWTLARRSWRFDHAGVACASVAGVYLAGLAMSNLNEGVRHLLPLFPLAALLVGRAVRDAMSAAKWVVVGLFGILAIETAIAHPNHLAWFNAAAGGAEGGYHLLGDSNLDWGQDLPALADWQRENPGVRLYLAWGGATDPGHYGIRYLNIPPGYPFGPPLQQIGPPGVIAIGASVRQGLYAPDDASRQMYKPLDRLQRLDVLNGTIYLYVWNP